MYNFKFSMILVCPWCRKGKMLASTRANTKLSCHCHVCGRYYIADLATGKTTKAQPLSAAK